MYDYQEACPVSRASSVLCERWTLQIIREMLFGACRFSELQSYLPKLSPSLLNTRLKTLEQQGLIIKKRVPEKRGYEYQLTPCGKALKPVITEFGRWGMRWVFEGLSEDQLNVASIVRDFAVSMDLDELPAGDTTIQFTIEADGNPEKRFVMVRGEAVQVCDDNLGTEVDLYLSASLKVYAKIWYGELSIAAAIKSGGLKVVGNSVYTKGLSRWLRVSQFSGIREGGESSFR